MIKDALQGGAVLIRHDEILKGSIDIRQKPQFFDPESEMVFDDLHQRENGDHFGFFFNNQDAELALFFKEIEGDPEPLKPEIGIVDPAFGKQFVPGLFKFQEFIIISYTFDAIHQHCLPFMPSPPSISARGALFPLSAFPAWEKPFLLNHLHLFPGLRCGRSEG
ncbi:MAG TPA: hypothetical protein PKY55_05545 [bacterium]|nr:hypothetical protein [bacterium]